MRLELRSGSAREIETPCERYIRGQRGKLTCLIPLSVGREFRQSRARRSVALHRNREHVRKGCLDSLEMYDC
jgi:hypothetical protein